MKITIEKNLVDIFWKYFVQKCCRYICPLQVCSYKLVLNVKSFVAIFKQTLNVLTKLKMQCQICGIMNFWSCVAQKNVILFALGAKFKMQTFVQLEQRLIPKLVYVKFSKYNSVGFGHFASLIWIWIFLWLISLVCVQIWS